MLGPSPNISEQTNVENSKLINPVLATFISAFVAINLVKPGISYGLTLTAGLGSVQHAPPCPPKARSLNPFMIVDGASNPGISDQISDAFKKAYMQATSADWEGAIASYQEIWSIADCGCDRLHALAGKRAAQESLFYQKMYGPTSRPAQFFWSRFKYLTRDLPCVQKY